MNKYLFLTLSILFFVACETHKSLPQGPFYVDYIDGATLHTVDGAEVKIPGMGKADQVTYFLVRHSEKSGEAGPDPRLSEQGLARAKKLSEILEKVPMDKIYSSDYHRTRDTARPLADKQGMTTLLYDPREQLAHFDGYMSGDEGLTMLVVGHSNTIPQLINILLGEEKYAPLGHDDYDDLFIVTSKGPNKAEVMELKY
ncbi:MAG: phosphoglycerate mutase family protein [Bacteroidota bacterium]